MKNIWDSFHGFRMDVNFELDGRDGEEGCLERVDVASFELCG